jgi:hypothetical protein
VFAFRVASCYYVCAQIWSSETEQRRSAALTQVVCNAETLFVTIVDKSRRTTYIMLSDQAVIYSFCLYVLYVLLPLIPAVLIFKFFPDTKVTVSGPLQNLTLNATGAFAAYVVTTSLGFFLVRGVQAQIAFTRVYPVQGVIDLADNQIIHSSQFYVRNTTDVAGADGRYKSQELYFVDLLDQPVDKATLWLDYWELPAASGIGLPPQLGAPQAIQLAVAGRQTSLQHFRLEHHGGVVVATAR